MIYAVSFLILILIGLSFVIHSQKNKKNDLEKKLSAFEDYKDVFETKDKAVAMLKEAERVTSALDNLKILNIKELEEYKDRINKEAHARINESKIEAEKILVNARIESRALRGANEERAIELESLKLKLVEESKNEAKMMVEEAKEKVKQFEVKAQEKLDTAFSVAEKLMTLTQEEINDLKSGALEFQRNHLNLVGVVKALENTIKGYGDQYFMGSSKLIEELGQSYSHIQAGKDLLIAKSLSENLITKNLAADCDYADLERRRTAVEFVLDAFTGKFESLISTAKKSDFGTLKQELTDTFHMINKHGAAFKNARITEIFLKAKLEEIKLLCVIQSFKEQEKEEQRAIREQMRDEEKAAREIERAIKETEEEEKKISKIIAKLKLDLEKASEQEKEKYELKLRDMQVQLKEAEEKNVRALSMAQKTKVGNVYVISNIGSFGEDIFKIGMTRRLEPQDRIDELGDASVPFEFDVHAFISCEDAPALEKELHRIFINTQVNKVNVRKEFFNVGLEEIKLAVEKLGYNIQWTMKAGAQEYRESLFLKNDKKVKNNAA